MTGGQGEQTKEQTDRRVQTENEFRCRAPSTQLLARMRFCETGILEPGLAGTTHGGVLDSIDRRLHIPANRLST